MTTTETVDTRRPHLDGRLDSRIDDLLTGTHITVELFDEEDVSGPLAATPGAQMLWIARPSGAWRAIYRQDIRNLRTR